MVWPNGGADPENACMFLPETEQYSKYSLAGMSENWLIRPEGSRLTVETIDTVLSWPTNDAPVSWWPTYVAYFFFSYGTPTLDRACVTNLTRPANPPLAWRGPSRAGYTVSEWGCAVSSGGGLARRMRAGFPAARRGVGIAALDVDGTLIDGRLGWPLLRLLHESELVPPARLTVVKRDLAQLPPDKFEDPRVIHATYRLYGETLAGVSCAAVDRPLEDVWALQRDDLFGFVRPLVGELRDAGFVPLLISGGIHELVGLMAALIGGRSIRWSESIAVGDALPDADLLERVGHPYAFEPTPSLAGRARAGGWTICGRDSLRPLIRSRLGIRRSEHGRRSVGARPGLSQRGWLPASRTPAIASTASSSPVATEMTSA
jgi:phosphoserine phosphatase